MAGRIHTENECYIEVHNQTQLMAAVKACPHDARTTIIAKRKDGGKHTLKLGPANPPVGFINAEGWFDKHLKSIVGKIRRTPAHVWK